VLTEALEVKFFDEYRQGRLHGSCL
jgi:hypothetical protein